MTEVISNLEKFAGTKMRFGLNSPEYNPFNKLAYFQSTIGSDHLKA